MTHRTTRIRRNMGFEMNPARCVNCNHYKPASFGTPRGIEQKQRYFRAPQCGLGGFVVKAHSICDKWVGKDGETLEQADQECAA